MNVVITGITGLRNRGVEALVVPTIEQLRILHPDLGISVMTKTPDYDRTRVGKFDVNLIDSVISHKTSSKSRLQRLKTKLLYYRYPITKETPALRSLKEASMVIASGGDVFSSDYGSLYKHLKPLEIALDNNIPVVFLAHSIGPFKTDKETQAWLKVARRSKFISVREKISYKYLTEKLGLSQNLVKHTADPAFLLKPSEPSTVDKMLEFYGVNNKRPIIAVAISQGINSYSGCDRAKHIEVWHQVVKLLVDEFQAQVLIVPHVQETAVKNDDRVAATELITSLDFNPNVKLVGADHSASEFKGLIGACDMIIAERMHAAIAGLSSGICTVAVGYSIKARGIMTDLLGAESVEDKLLISINDFFNRDQMYTTVRNAWNCRQEIAHSLQKILPEVQQDSVNNFEIISQILVQENEILRDRQLETCAVS